MKSQIRLVYVCLALVLLLSVTGMSFQPRQLGPTELLGRARELVAAKVGISPQALELIGKPAVTRYPYSGAVLFQYKFHASIVSESYSIALTRRGVEADVEQYDAAELAAFAKRRGKLSPDLWELLRFASPEQMIEVNVWLKVPPLDAADEAAFQKPAVNGENVAADEASLQMMEAEVTNREMERMQAVTGPFVGFLSELGYASTPNQLAPMVNTSLPASLLRLIGARGDVDTIYLVHPAEDELNVARATINATTVHTAGFTGAGEMIGMVEATGIVTGSNPNLTLTRSNPNNCAVGSHATGVAGIIRSTHATTRGIAPGASLWASCGTTDAQRQTATTAGITWGADTINLSWYSGSGLVPTALDRFMDRIMYTNYDLIVKSAGNNGPGYGTGTGNVTPPGLGYNTLTVGSFDDKNSTTWTGDVISPFSSYNDPTSTSSDREKPEVAAPGSSITTLSTASPWNNYTDSGTSFAAPMVTGMTALLMDRNSGLRAYPEAVKAIIMATAIHNIEGATRLSEKDGAGGIDASIADYVARNNQTRGRWGATSYTCSSSDPLTLATMTLTANKRVRIVIVWYQDPDYASYTTKPSADLDLELYRGATYLTGSHSFDNTYEIVDYTPTVTGTYTIKADRHRCSTSPKYLGWAWYQFP